MLNWWTRNSARVDVALVLMILAALAVLLVMIFALPFVGHAVARITAAVLQET